MTARLLRTTENLKAVKFNNRCYEGSNAVANRFSCPYNTFKLGLETELDCKNSCGKWSVMNSLLNNISN